VAYNFVTSERDQLYLLPPSLSEWLPEDHLAWFVLDCVEEMDLDAFYAKYREDGWGGAAHDPRTMVALLVYAYCLGVRSSRQIERACQVDVGFRVICGGLFPDHTTIARFRQRHEEALKTIFRWRPSPGVNVDGIAVGTALAGGPPHRSQRAGLPHWAPALGGGGEAHFGVGMLDPGGR